MRNRVVYAACLIVLVSAVAQGAGWNLAGDFSATRNPNGAWSYGWRATAVDPLVLYTDHDGQCPELIPWEYNMLIHCPNLTQNPNDYPVSCFTFVLQPHKLFFHPGPQQQSVVRWTAPTSQEVNLAVDFESIDVGSKIVHVYFNTTAESFYRAPPAVTA